MNIAWSRRKAVTASLVVVSGDTGVALSPTLQD